MYDAQEQAESKAVATIAIQQTLARYAHAIDRCDAALLDSVWARGAQVDYGGGVLAAREWAGGVLQRLSAFDRTMHSVTNMLLLSFDGVTAKVQSCCLAYHQGGSAAPDSWLVAGGRYLDDCVLEDGDWLIHRRQYVMDWNESGASTCLLGAGAFAAFTRIGQRGHTDPAYAHGLHHARGISERTKRFQPSAQP